MMTEHTKEPWAASPYGEVLDVEGAGVVVAGFHLSTGRRNFKADANARRIVACVNACAGLDTALLENITMFGNTLKDRIDVLLNEANQRDQLLEALERIADPRLSPSSGDPVVLRDIAKAAIAAVKGGAA